MNAHNLNEGFGSMFSSLVAFASPVQNAITGQSLYERAPRLGLDLGGWLDRLSTKVSTWAERKQQRQLLLQLDDRLLRDIGISRADAEDEGLKPFWRA
jgi:uncharacterized protein YjiS (DUF1127 family)